VRVTRDKAGAVGRLVECPLGRERVPIRYGSMYAFSYDSTLPTLYGANVQKYSSAWTVNAEAHVNVLANLTLAIGGTDIFNRYPDQTTPGGSYYGAFPYNFANPVGINGAFYYLRASVKLDGQ
jgi:iron complex outermembrane receptor protein